MEFKKLSAVESVVEPAQSANVLIEEDGVIKKAPKSVIGAQADWNEVDESSPAFIKNKPDYDLDITVTLTRIDASGNYEWDYDVHYIKTFEEVVEKLENGICPRIKAKFDTRSCVIDDPDNYYVYHTLSVGCSEYGADYIEEYGDLLFGTFTFNAFQLMVCYYSSGIYFEVYYNG